MPQVYTLQTHTGTYNKAECLDSNNLLNNLMLRPEILEDLIFSNKGYTLSFLTYGLGQFGNNRIRRVIQHQRAFSWGVLGRVHKAIYFVRHVSGIGTGGEDITAVAMTNWANPKDVIKLENGQQMITLAKPIKTVDGYQYRFRLIRTVLGQTVAASNFAAGKRGGVIGNVFENGSKRGYGNVVYPDQYTNWSTISRAGVSWDNEGILNVVWYKNPETGTRMWAYEEQRQVLDKVLWETEQQNWYQHMTTFDGGETWEKDEDGKDLMAGAGYFQQVAGANEYNYVPGSSDLIAKIQAAFGSLIRGGNGLTYNQVGIHTGQTYGAAEFHRSMQADFQKGFKTLFYSPSREGGRSIEVGEWYRSYNFNNLEGILMGNMLFEDPEIHVDRSINGAPREAYTMVMTPISSGNDSNVAAISRRSIDGKINRDFVVKKFPGMISLDGNANTEFAVTSEDAYREEYLFEHGVAVFDPRMSAKLTATVATS